MPGRLATRSIRNLEDILSVSPANSASAPQSPRLPPDSDMTVVLPSSIDRIGGCSSPVTLTVDLQVLEGHHLPVFQSVQFRA
jgi:hypothetical protein